MTQQKLYLDNCCFNRPFDDQSQLRVRLETGMERFVDLVNKEPGDYTAFRHTLFEGMSHDDICRGATQAKIEADERMAGNR